jgi:hypothetical protein
MSRVPIVFLDTTNLDVKVKLKASPSPALIDGTPLSVKVDTILDTISASRFWS